MITERTAFADRLRDQLATYKAKQWPDLPHGFWMEGKRKVECPHILPECHQKLNILPCIQDRFWPWFEARKRKIKLHQFFHHLNSSQALCFNLFFPFLKEDGKTVDARLLEALGTDTKGDFTGCFEKVLNTRERTNFDFYLKGDAGQEIFFEFKLTESKFGGCDGRDVYRRRLNEIYRPLLEAIVDSFWLQEEMFFEHYQILRNISYLSRGPKTKSFFIFPKANECLKPAEETIRKIADHALDGRVTILHLEDLLERVIDVTKDDPALQQHFHEFKQKYVLAEAAT